MVWRALARTCAMATAGRRYRLRAICMERTRAGFCIEVLHTQILHTDSIIMIMIMIMMIMIIQTLHTNPPYKWCVCILRSRYAATLSAPAARSSVSCSVSLCVCVSLALSLSLSLWWWCGGEGGFCAVDPLCADWCSVQPLTLATPCASATLSQIR